MADVKGVNMTTLAGGDVDKLEAGAWGGRVRVRMDSYEASTLAADSTIEVAKLPKGARVLPQSMVMADALGTGVTLSLGNAGDAEQYLAAVEFNTGGQSKTLDGIDGICAKLETEETVLITVGAAAATGTIRSVIFYSLD